MDSKETIFEVIFAVAPITILVIILNFTVGNLPPETFFNFIGAVVMVVIGLILFLIGANSGLLYVGESIGSSVLKSGKLWFILLGGFLIGFVVTLAEPGVQVLATNVDSASDGAIGKYAILLSVSLGVAIFLALSLLRLVLKLPLSFLLLSGYGVILILSFFTHSEFLPVSFDAGSVTTGPMTVPFILSLGVGVSSVRGRKGNSSNDSFGLVGLASIGPIIAVMLLGVFLN